MFLEAAKVQGFTWDQDTYEFEEEPDEGGRRGKTYFVQPVIDERTYLVLVQRYKELFAGGIGPGGALRARWSYNGD